MYSQLEYLLYFAQSKNFLNYVCCNIKQMDVVAFEEDTLCLCCEPKLYQPHISMLVIFVSYAGGANKTTRLENCKSSAPKCVGFSRLTIFFAMKRNLMKELSALSCDFTASEKKVRLYAETRFGFRP